MFELFRKEVVSFFSSITGYLVILAFLSINGLFLWVFPGNLNILDGGYATLDSLFYLAPWVFLFLIPAITMRAFSDEKKAGTLELLFTRPISDYQIVLAKFLAGTMLVLLSLAPCLIYYYSVSHLGQPAGNIDKGGSWGSFIGLFFLASIYVSIGIFASSLSDNSIVSFLLGVLLCFFVYTGFDYIATLVESGQLATTISLFSIESHYQSMSRGVIDSRDALYFIGVSFLFTFLTKTKLASRNW